jgi:hypothetical protein
VPDKKAKMNGYCFQVMSDQDSTLFGRNFEDLGIWNAFQTRCVCAQEINRGLGPQGSSDDRVVQACIGQKSGLH